MVTTRMERQGRVEKYYPEKDGERLSYSQVANLWISDAAFRTHFMKILEDSEWKAYFFETPPVTLSNFDREFEFVLVDSPSLARVSANGSPFKDFFNDDYTVTFPNLRGDAILVVPCPDQDFPHLAAFMRTASEERKHDFWIKVGEARAPRR